MITCCIFDLDGVLVDTARYHYLAWRELAERLGFEFTPEQGETTKGVSRMASLDIVLRAGGMENRFTEEEKLALAAEKNSRYLEYVGQMTREEVLPGVLPVLEELRSRGIRLILGSASKNAGAIIDRCDLRRYFECVIDGNLVSKAKPDPEVFAKGAEMLGISPAECVVFEDAAAGIEAATRAGMRSVGVGGNPSLCKANLQIDTFMGFSYEKLLSGIEK